MVTLTNQLINYMLTNATINTIISMPPKCNPSVMYASPSDLHDPKMIWVPKWFRRPSLKQTYPYLSKITFCSPHPEDLNKYKYNKSLNLKRQRSVIKYVPLCSNIHNQQWSGTSNSFLLMNQQYNLERQRSVINMFHYVLTSTARNDLKSATASFEPIEPLTFNRQSTVFFTQAAFLSLFLPHLPTIAKPIQT